MDNTTTVSLIAERITVLRAKCHCGKIVTITQKPDGQQFIDKCNHYIDPPRVQDGVVRFSFSV